MSDTFLFSSESVNEGHPGKYIILDVLLRVFMLMNLATIFFQ